MMVVRNPNELALLVILLSPLIFYVIFQKYRLPLAAALCAVGGFMFLPVAPRFNLPALPTLDKATIPLFAVMLFSIMAIAADKSRRRMSMGMRTSSSGKLGKPPKLLSGWMPKGPLARILVVVLPASAFLTGFSNQFPIVLANGAVLPAYSLYSTLSLVMNTGMLLLPILIGRRIFAFPDAQRTLLKVLAAGAAIYAVFGLFEARFSPQLNIWIYGFFPHEWLQHVRAGGFRPVVFMPHGLMYAIFLCLGLLAAFGLYRVREDVPKPKLWLGFGIWTLAVLAVSNSLGAMVISLAFIPMLLFLSTRGQLLMASLIGLMMLTYPIMRERGLVPTEKIVSAMAVVSDARANSLAFRLRHEDKLLAHVQQQYLAGWGSFGRNVVYDEETGKNMSVTDGYWIIALGVGGILRYITEYGLLTLPFWILLFRGRRLSVGRETSVVALILAANMIDMVPNGSNTMLTGLLAGALLGRLEVAQAEADKQQGQGQRRGGRMQHRSRTVKGGFVSPGAVARDDDAPLTSEAAGRTEITVTPEVGGPEATGGAFYSRYGPKHVRRDKKKKDKERSTRRPRRSRRA